MDQGVRGTGVLQQQRPNCRSSALMPESCGDRRYVRGRQKLTALATVFLEIPSRSAIDLLDPPSARCSRRLRAQSSTVITHPIVWNRRLSSSRHNGARSVRHRHLVLPVLMLQQFVIAVQQELVPVVKAHPRGCSVVVDAKSLRKRCFFSANAPIGPTWWKCCLNPATECC